MEHRKGRVTWLFDVVEDAGENKVCVDHARRDHRRQVSADKFDDKLRRVPLKRDTAIRRLGSIDFLMSLNMPEKIEGFIQFLGVDEDSEDNKLCVQYILVDHRRQGTQGKLTRSSGEFYAERAWPFDATIVAKRTMLCRASINTRELLLPLNSRFALALRLA